MTGATTPLGLGLVGCGGFGAFLLDAVAGLPGLRPVAVADPDPERAGALGQRHAVPALAGLDDLLAREESSRVPCSSSRTGPSPFLTPDRVRRRAVCRG
ncbi:hypothetical protein ABZX83_24740 [Streptomyces thermoviolaceus]|uniref:hypothetical protein n=1 Tax=Streptomyces thermoviolaceus TaxID=1952 RepID=UPI0033A0E4EC